MRVSTRKPGVGAAAKFPFSTPPCVRAKGLPYLDVILVGDLALPGLDQIRDFSRKQGQASQ